MMPMPNMKPFLGAITLLFIFSVGQLETALAQPGGNEAVLVQGMFLVFTFGAAGIARAHPQDAVLAQGSPPLTQSMVDKSIGFLEWTLEIQISPQHRSMLQRVVMRAWQTKSQDEMKSTLDIVDIHDKLVRMSDADRNKLKGQLQVAILENLRKETNDELSRSLVAAYEAARATNAVSPSPSNSSSTTTRNIQRVGADGFTGIYRMVRPRALNINSTRAEPGYWIEHITFLPSRHVYWRLPQEGLLYFDPAVAQRAHPNDWGTYEIRGGEIHIFRGPNKQRYVITRNGERLNNPPSLGKGSFRPVPPADGLKLEGNYRRHQTEPTITFSADGRFRDGGVFRYFGDLERPGGAIYRDDGVGGSGTYLIEQNTLELCYSDGRVKRFPFVAFPENLAKNPALDSFILRAQERMSRY
jgi:hypothetical protein